MLISHYKPRAWGRREVGTGLLWGLGVDVCGCLEPWEGLGGPWPAVSWRYFGLRWDCCWETFDSGYFIIVPGAWAWP